MKERGNVQSWSGDGVAKAGRMWLSGCAATVSRGGEAEKQRRHNTVKMRLVRHRESSVAMVFLTMLSLK